MGSVSKEKKQEESLWSCPRSRQRVMHWSSREDKDRWCNLDVTWTVCYPWACTSSRLRIGTPGIARSSSTPKNWLRDGRNLPPEVLCWDIFSDQRGTGYPGYLERSRKYPWRRIGLCWKGEESEKTGSRKRERERKNVCEFVYVRSDLEFCFWHHWQGSETKRSEVISVI